ncbi:hypothetical protein [Leptothermofonsia sp. ETS-13]|uniref:hypothetical protein n=1 Tax=Leptothermofonsia sp. ETS-13 TaxID=3035696 RepID=UPI003B9E0B31
MTVAALMLAYPAIAQPVPAKARNACIQRTAEEMVVATRDITVIGAGPIDPENGVRNLFMRNTRTGQTATCRVNTIDGFVLSVTLGGGNVPPPVVSPPSQGNFQGRGNASGGVFGRGRRADASLSFNRNRFNLRVFVPPGTRTQVQYLGTIRRIRNTNPSNPNTFVIEGRIDSFASSANNLRVINTRGNCRIDVFDARITSTSCSANAPGSATQFRGMSQF